MALGDVLAKQQRVQTAQMRAQLSNKRIPAWEVLGWDYIEYIPHINVFQEVSQK